MSGLLSRQRVSKWETGENYPSMTNILCLCDIFKCKIKNMNEINDSFFNIGGIAVTFEDVQTFLSKNIFGKELIYIRSLRRDKIQSGGDFSFQLIENKNDLVGPVYLSDLIIKPYKLVI